MKEFKSVMVALAVAVLFITSTNAWSLDAASVPEKKQTMAKLYLGAEEVVDFMASKKGKALFIDVRSMAELAFVGNTSAMTANIPFKTFSTKKFNEKKGKFSMVTNPNFVAQVEKLMTANKLTKDDPVILMCRSGGRSANAADDLTTAGFKNVYSVVDGFEGDKAKDGDQKGQRVVNGWKNKKQPWGYKLDKAKLTLEK
jgi:rhodanese-related sulfurtransferase